MNSVKLKRVTSKIYVWLFLLFVKLFRLGQVINCLIIKIFPYKKSNTVKFVAVKVCANLTLNMGYIILARAKIQSPAPLNSF